MRRSIQSRNTMFSAGMVLISFLILSLLFSAVLLTYVIRDRRNTLESTAAVVADVAAAVAFFASEEAGYLTGQVLCVDGGMAV